VRKTKPTQVPIGERRKPDPEGRPGYLRVDTVHQGDLEREKGVYPINTVDEITQWEVVGCVEKISEFHLTPLLEDLIEQYPFRILGFHSDNGSEYINKVVAQLLNKLLIGQTKSRARHCNDNALVEGKNGSVIRKTTGRMHIPQKYAAAINEFYKDHLNVYLTLNYKTLL
jgi:transposase InsO family protein